MERIWRQMHNWGRRGTPEGRVWESWFGCGRNSGLEYVGDPCISENDSQFIRPSSRLEGILSGDILNLRSKRREIDSLLTVGDPRKMLKPFITLLTVHIEEGMLDFRFGEEYWITIGREGKRQALSGSSHKLWATTYICWRYLVNVHCLEWWQSSPLERHPMAPVRDWSYSLGSRKADWSIAWTSVPWMLCVSFRLVDTCPE